MKIKDLEELEIHFNEIGARLNQVESLSKILLDCICSNDNLKPQDVENLISVLDEKITKLKAIFNFIEQELNI